MSRKQITLGTAEFLDSEEARALADLERADLRRVVEALLAACYDELGVAPHLLDGESTTHLLADALPGRLRPRDPVAARVPDILSAFVDHLETRRTVPHAFEVRRALDEGSDAFLAAVRSGSAERRALPADAPVVHRAEKVGRNDPCFCGSGKKFKKCCGRDA